MPRLSKTLAYSVLFFIFCLCSCSNTEQSWQVEGQVLPVDSLLAASIDHEVDSFIDFFRAPLLEEMNRVLVYSAQPMRKGTPEDLLNNFVADLVLDQGRRHYMPDDNYQIDFCVLNYGGLRSSLPEGPVTQSRVFELMPFENEMVVLTLSAENTWKLFQYIASRSVGTPVSGIRLGIRDRDVDSVQINGEPFVRDKLYKILTSDYLASAGDDMSFFLEPLKYELIGMRIRDAIILHMEQEHMAGKMIKSELDGRLYYAR